MKRRAKILCALGLIEIAISAILLFVFEHVPYPWGAGTLPGGLGQNAAQFEQTMRWQASVLVSLIGIGSMGIFFVLAACVIFVISKLKPVPEPN